MNKQKRMIYIWGDNLEFYDKLENKSEFINQKIAEERNGSQTLKENVQAAREQLEVPEKFPGYDHPDPRMRELRRDIWVKENRDKKRLADSREN